MFWNILQLVLAIALTVMVVLQAKGSGLGSTFGGTSTSYHSKRGVERVVFVTTIVLAIIFTLVSIINFAL